MKTPSDATCAPNERISQRADVRLAAFSQRGVALACVALAAGVAGCNLHNPGYSPPEDELSYPVGVALSRESTPRSLFVANSNFDLKYNAASVHVYDLEALEGVLRAAGCRERQLDPVALDGSVQVVPDGTVIATSMDGGAASMDAGVPTTGDAGVRVDAGSSPMTGTITLPPDYEATSEYGNARGVLCAGRDTDPAAAACCLNGSSLAEIRRQSLRIDSFATGIVTSRDGRRLYVPVNSRSVLLDIDVSADGTLDCGNDGSDDACRRGPGYQRTDPERDDDPDGDFPGQPATMTVGVLGDLGVTESPALAAQGKSPATPFAAMAHDLGGVSLFVEKPNGRLVLESVIDEAIPRGTATIVRPTAIVLSPTDHQLYVASAGQSFITRFGVRIDPDAVDDEPGARELLYSSGVISVVGLADARDLREVAFDPREPRRLFALVRGLQESVAFLERDRDDPSSVRLVDAVRVGAGPSKLTYITVAERGYLLVSCYDARSIFIIDVGARRLVAMVRNLSGPYQMVFDGVRNLLHVADFRASVLRVVDLAWLADKRKPPPRIIATLGSPRFEGGLE